METMGIQHLLLWSATAAYFGLQGSVFQPIYQYVGLKHSPNPAPPDELVATTLGPVHPCTTYKQPNLKGNLWVPAQTFEIQIE